MKVIKTNINDAILFEPNIYEDERGYFFESWNLNKFKPYLKDNANFVQDNHSFSKKNVIRGLHYQISPHSQSKLVTVLKGKVLDVVVDIRKGSSTFCEWTSLILDNSNKFMIWIPSGFAHGFLSLENNSEVIYKASGLWSKEHERSLRWDDKNINISWPLEKLNCTLPHLSEKDASAPFLKNAEIFN